MRCVTQCAGYLKEESYTESDATGCDRVMATAQVWDLNVECSVASVRSVSTSWKEWENASSKVCGGGRHTDWARAKRRLSISVILIKYPHTVIGHTVWCRTTCTQG